MHYTLGDMRRENDAISSEQRRDTQDAQMPFDKCGGVVGNKGEQ